MIENLSIFDLFKNKITELNVNVKETVKKKKKKKDVNTNNIVQLDLFSAIATNTEEKTNKKEIPTVKKEDDKTSTFTLQEKMFTSLGGIKTRIKNNIKAIKLVKELRKFNRKCNFIEKEILAQYVGWGGIPQIFDERESKKEQFQNEREELKNILTEEEYCSAERSVLNAYYTSGNVIKFMYAALNKMGFKKGYILEPSCGIGNFIGFMPSEIKNNSEITGIEIDKITGEICKQLYENADIRVQGFQESLLPENHFDLVVGNVPFGDIKLSYKNDNYSIHNYFFLQSLDKVREGGIIAFVTSMFTMDSKDNYVRKLISEKANLVFAVRLPNTAFKEYAKTEVVTDIIFLQKKSADAPMNDYTKQWLKLNRNAQDILINNYYIENPQCILGTLQKGNKLYRGNEDSSIVVLKNETLDNLLDNVLTSVPLNIYSYKKHKKENKELNSLIPVTNGIKEGSYELINNEVYERVGNYMKPLKLTRNVEKIKEYISLKYQVRETIKVQLDGCSDTALKEEQSRLNNIYDNFINKYGFINANNNAQALRNDPDYYMVCSLEELKEGKYIKTSIFTERTLAKEINLTHVDTIEESLIVSINLKGGIDFEYMSSLVNKPIEDIINELYGKYIFKNPLTEKYELHDEYLSGNVKEKLTRAEKAAETDSLYAVNVKALEEAQPERIKAKDIMLKLGSPWIPTNIYQEFISYLLECDKTKISVTHSDLTSDWEVYSNIFIPEAINCKRWGTFRVSALKLIEMGLNSKYPTVKDKVYDAIKDKDVYKINPKETSLARAKLSEIKTAFLDWIFDDEARRYELEDIYNEKINNLVARKYNGDFLTFPGMNSKVKLRKYQKDAIARCIFGGSSLLAHCVGAGKTYVMCAAVMKMKQVGIINKALICVPNSLVQSGQFAREFQYLYPNAKLLIAAPSDFEKSNRKRLFSKIALGNWDAIIMAHSSFGMIDISIERKKEYLKEEIYEIKEYLRNTEQRSVKDLNKKLINLQEQLEHLNSSKTDDLITFEEMGIDLLAIDEAHNFKKLQFYTKLSRLPGVDGSGNKRTANLLNKIKYLYELKGEGKGVIMATGTPISNSMCEMFTMQKYLQPHILKKYGIYNFDDWASTFGEAINALEIDPTGTKYRQKTRFAQFFNVPELMTIFRQCADIVTSDMLDIKRPELEGGKPIVVEVEKDDRTTKFVDSLLARAEAISKGSVDRKDDNMLVVTNDGRKVALDYRLIDSTATESDNSKIKMLCDKAYDEWKNGSENKLTQLIFCDLGTPSASKQSQKTSQEELLDNAIFNVYKDIKKKLIFMGIPAEEIAFIHDAETPTKRKKLIEKFKTGEVRIIIGSTSKCGEGTNFQDRLVALHELSIPWRPSDVEQRLGRILRYGNMNQKVRVYRYIMKGTFDAYMWQTIQRKAQYISQVMNGKNVSRKISDVDEQVLNYKEMTALASGNPLILDKLKIDKKVTELQLLYQQYKEDKFYFQDKIKECNKDIAIYSKRKDRIKKDIQLKENNEIDSFSMNINNKQFDERILAGAELIEMFKNIRYNDEKLFIGTFRGFNLFIEKVFIADMSSKNIYIQGSNLYKISASSSEIGNITRIENLLSSLEETLEKLDKKINENKLEVINLEKDSIKDFKYKKQLEEALDKQREIEAQLSTGAEEEILDNEEEIA